MADTQEAPHPATQPIPAQSGSIAQAQEALLGIMDSDGDIPEDKPKAEEAQPEEVEESTEETQDESSEEVSEEEEESVEEEEESEEELDEDEVEEEPEVYAVKVDGEELEVSLDELMQGYSRQSDYTRKTQELASQRDEMAQLQQQWTNEMAQAQAERQQYIDAIGQFVQNSMGGLEQFQNVDWENLRQTDPIAFVTKKEELREAQDRVRQAQEEQGRVNKQQQEEMAKMRQLAIQEEHTKLIAAVPEWNDTGKRSKMASELSTYALDQGFSKEELKQLIDHRSLIVLMKAQKYDALQKSDVKAKKIKNKPKVVRSGKGINKKSNDRSKRVAKMKRLGQTGHVDDAALLLEDFVEL